MAYGRPNPIAALLQALTGGFQAGQGYLQQQHAQEFQQRQFEAAQQRYQQEQAQQDAARQYAQRMERVRIALSLANPKDRLAIARANDINIPDGIQPYDPGEDAINKTIGGSLINNAHLYQNPGALVDAGVATMRGQQLPSRPPTTIGIPGIGVPGASKPLTTTLPGASGFQAAYDQAGQPIADLRAADARRQQLLLKQQDDQRLRDLETERTNRALKVAGIKAESAARIVGLQAGTKEDQAWRSTYTAAHLQAQREYPDNPELWEPMAARAAAGAVQSFRDRRGAEAVPPLPDFAGQLPPSISSQKLGMQGRRLDIQQEGVDNRYSLGSRGLDLRSRGLDISQQNANTRQSQGNRGLDLKSRGLDIQAARGARGAAGKPSFADQQELKGLDETYGRLENAIIFDTEKAQNGDKKAQARIATARNGMENIRKRKQEILSQYGTGPQGAAVGGLMNDLGLTGKGAAPAPANTSGGFSPALKAVRQKHFAAFQQSRHRPPTPAEQNIISQMVEDGRLK